MLVPFVSRSLSSSLRTKNPSFFLATRAVTNPVEKYWTHLQSNDPNIEKALTRVGAKLDSSCVKELLTRCSCTNKHPTSGLRFFIWAGIQREYRHNSHMYNIACKLFNINQNPNLITDVIDAYTLDNSVVNLKSFKVVLNLCKEAKLPNEGLWVLKKMQDFNCKPDTTAYNLVIRVFCEKGKMDEALMLMQEMSLSNLYPDMVTFITMVKSFCDLGRIQDASKLFKIVKQQGCSLNVIAYSTLLDGICKVGDLEKGLNLLDEMNKKGGSCTPTVVTYTSMIRNFCEKKKSMEALTILDRMENNGCLANRVTVTTFINGLITENRIDEAYKLIDRVVNKGNVSKGECYSSLVVTLLRFGKDEDGEKVFRKMLSNGLKPDGLACSMLLKKMCLKEVMDAFEVCNEIEKLGFVSSIDSEIYSMMMDGLCRKGCLMEASKLARLMIEKGVRLNGSYSESVVEYLNNAGEMELVSRIFGG
ncbi:hypothetical protein LXL04_008961 [Taraxacum kok-saghyz]